MEQISDFNRIIYAPHDNANQNVVADDNADQNVPQQLHNDDSDDVETVFAEDNPKVNRSNIQTDVTPSRGGLMNNAKDFEDPLVDVQQDFDSLNSIERSLDSLEHVSTISVQ